MSSRKKQKQDRKRQRASERAASQPGVDAIDDAVRPLHGGAPPTVLYTIEDTPENQGFPLRGIGVWESKTPRPNWFFVTYGLTELHEKQTADPATSGFGHELTFRLAKGKEKEPPEWSVRLFKILARHLGQRRQPFVAGHHMSFDAPFCDRKSEVKALAFIEDPELGPRITPNGRMEFLRLVGITLDELRAIFGWDTRPFLDLLRRANPLLITDMDRTCSMKDPELLREINEGFLRDGSTTTGTFVDQLSWRREGDGLRITLGAVTNATIQPLLIGRTGLGRPLTLQGATTRIELLPPAPGAPPWREAAKGALILRVDPSLAEPLHELLEPKRGERRLEGLPGVVFEVLPSELKDKDGKVFQVVG
jgi:suppressor of fused-like protein